MFGNICYLKIKIIITARVEVVWLYLLLNIGTTLYRRCPIGQCIRCGPLQILNIK